MAYEDLTGKRFGRLVVIEYAGRINEKNMWKCKCDCENVKNIIHGNLINGTTTSCGCFHKEMMSALNKSHGLSSANKRLYKIWKEMRYRCNKPNNKSYARYGGRGIKVCDEWNKSFVPFYEWAMKNGYKEEISENNRNKWSIDRIDNDGNYEPNNCRWATDTIQANNKSQSIPEEEKIGICPICGKEFKRTSRNVPLTCSRKCGNELSRLKRISTKDYTKICPVCNKPFDAKRGGHYKEAVCCSKKCAKLHSSPIWELNGEKHRVIEWADKLGMTAHCLHHRIEMGWTIEEALTIPKGAKRCL